jgi:hypothetical protein
MDEKEQKEFDKFKNCIIYLDWNIFSYILDPSKILNNKLLAKVLSFEHLYRKNIKKDVVAFPFSNGHFLDIKQGDNSLRDDKLNLIEDYSKKWMISEDSNNKEKVCLRKIPYLINDYKEYCDSLEESQKISEKLQPVLNKIVKADIDLAKEKINESADSKLKSLSLNLLSSIDSLGSNKSGFDILKINKKMRSERINYNGSKFKFPGINENILELEIDEIIRNIIMSPRIRTISKGGLK